MMTGTYIWKVLRCCLLFSVQSHPVLCLVTYYMAEMCSQSLLKMVDHEISTARLRLSNEKQMYRMDMMCLMSIRAPADHMLMVRFLSMEIEGFMSQGCESDYMVIYDGPDDHSPSIKPNSGTIQYTKTPDTNRLCGSLIPRATFVTTGDTVTFKFFSDMSRQYRGFDLIFTSFHTGDCDAGEFSCKNDRCINASLHCNDYNNCGDDSDWCGPNTTLVIFVILICVSVFVLLVWSVFRCSSMEKVKRFPKSKSAGADDDLITTTEADIRVGSFRGFNRRDSTISPDSSSEPQHEPLLHESTSSV